MTAPTEYLSLFLHIVSHLVLLLLLLTDRGPKSMWNRRVSKDV